MRSIALILPCLLLACAEVSSISPRGSLTIRLPDETLALQTSGECIGICHASLGWHSDAIGANFMTLAKDEGGDDVSISVGWNGAYVPGGMPDFGLVSILRQDSEWSGRNRLTQFDLTLGEPVTALAAQARPGAVFVEGQLEFAGTICRLDAGGDESDDCIPVSGTYVGPVQVSAQNLAAAGVGGSAPP